MAIKIDEPGHAASGPPTPPGATVASFVVPAGACIVMCATRDDDWVPTFQGRKMTLVQEYREESGSTIRAYSAVVDTRP